MSQPGGSIACPLRFPLAVAILAAAAAAGLLLFSADGAEASHGRGGSTLHEDQDREAPVTPATMVWGSILLLGILGSLAALLLTVATRSRGT